MAWPAEHYERLQRAFSGAQVCVTGGAGFIGATLVEKLLEFGAEVVVIDDLSGSTSARLTTLLEKETRGSARFVYASILEPRALLEAVSGASVVFHLAAISSPVMAQEEPVRCMQVNGLGTARVAEAARKAGAERLVYAGSASAYGDTTGANRETQAPAPISPYGASKLAGEHVITSWARSRGLDGVNLRFFNIFGVGQSPDSEYAAVIPAFAKRLKANTAPTIYGDGGQTRDFVHVDDVVRALLLAGANDDSLDGATINIGSGRAVSIRELAEIMARLCGAEGLTPNYEAARAGDIRESLCDASLAADLLGFEAVTTLEDGLRDVLKDCRGRSAAAI